ncbi:CPBP family intramembrane glutamic endopeptidase [Paraburkholderia caledonica]|uniref:CPBP family intramembrane glutamic endopeptidase n=1 Tax=Paraburkholderia caledonica TaxID=134536 RepID=UPI0004877242|nr:CPBP family intramembrane glutamic endopeptidase [Paraburkholderia caledonica]
MAALPWIAIFIAAATAIFRAPRRLTLVLLAIGYGLAFALGQLHVLAIVPIALLLCTGILLQWNPSPLGKLLCNVVFAILALGLFQHWLPGFQNLKVIDAARFTPDAAPYTMYLNFDKPLIGFWLLLTYPWVQPKKSFPVVAVSALGACALTSAVCLFIAFEAGSIAWAPKWPHLAWLWMLNNFLLVAFAEEAFFRGYIQAGIARLMNARPQAWWFGLIVAAVLFGLAHYQSGTALVVLAGLSGLGYGLAYRAGGLQAAMLTHFGLNLVQFGLFTYPFIARS